MPADVWAITLAVVIEKEAAAELFNDVALGRPVIASVFVGLGVHHLDDAQFDLGRLDALLIENLTITLFRGF